MTMRNEMRHEETAVIYRLDRELRDPNHLKFLPLPFESSKRTYFFFLKNLIAIKKARTGSGVHFRFVNVSNMSILCENVSLKVKAIFKAQFSNPLKVVTTLNSRFSV
jgi:hypothetical protein